MKNTILITLAAIAPFGAFGGFINSGDNVDVNGALVLLNDESGSIDAAEFDLLKQGYVDAFNSTAISSLFDQGGSIAVQYIAWSGAAQQNIVLDWFLIDSSADSFNYATQLSGISRTFTSSQGLTAPGDAIQFAGNSVIGSTGDYFTADTQIIDVFSDGERNDGLDDAATQNTRDVLESFGVTINAIVIDEGNAVNYHTNNIITSDGFISVSPDFNTFGTVLEDKIEVEVQTSTVPEPGTYLALASAAGIALAIIRRNRKAKA